VLCTTSLLFSGGSLFSAELPTESDYYRIVPLPIPKGVSLEVGALQLMPDGRLAVATRRGEIYMVSKPFSGKPKQIRFKRFAHGLHEVLGLAVKGNDLYATQRDELTRLHDSDGDGRADLFATVNDDWAISGDYHEYAFGSRFDREGNIWVALTLTGSFTSNVPYRGWVVRITPDGKMIPTCSGIRSPGGIGMNHLGEMFMTDNQGPWNGTCTLKFLRPGSFQGNPQGNKWYPLAKKFIGPRPVEPRSGSRIPIEAKRIPQFEVPAIQFPYSKMGKSASGVACDTTGGKFGPFDHQIFVGDQSDSTVMRCFLEKVNGHYQGACFPFRQGFGSGTLAMQLTARGPMFVGGTNRGWASRGRKPYSLERLEWTGKTPFEVREMRARPDGFELTFTRPVDLKTAGNLTSYKLATYTYIYQSSYGSPEVDPTTPTIRTVHVADNGLSARLVVDGLRIGHIHELHLDGIRSAGHLPLLHPVAYYTLNSIPKRSKNP